MSVYVTYLLYTMIWILVSCKLIKISYIVAKNYN